MTIQSTSFMAYKTIIEGLSKRRGKVFQAILELGRACDYEIAEYLHWPINCVTPRRGELKSMGYIEQACEKPCPPVGNVACVWKIIDAEPASKEWKSKIKPPKRKKQKTVLTASELGRRLVEFRHQKKYIKNKERLLF